MVMDILTSISHFLWNDYVLYFLLFVGIMFTVWSRFSQYQVITHGIALIRGKYDHAKDPGAISHFQALSAALSGTVGLGNIAGVALAVSVGGPGAIFWMWVVGFVGMALKTTEVIQAMMYRDISNPSEPHGGPMWVAKFGLAEISPKLKKWGTVLGSIYALTLLTATTTGGNMFQAWNVADLTYSYFHVPKLVSGIILTSLVGLVILGGIKRIGAVAGTLVPLMCGVYLVAGLVVVILHIQEIPALFKLIFTSAFPVSWGGSSTEPMGAFVGGTAGLAFLKGMQRAFFSNEAAQGSSPVAHSAVKTKEPVSEGIVAGLEPFVDTLIVCTITAMVILLSGTWNRGPDLKFVSAPTWTMVKENQWTMQNSNLEKIDIAQKTSAREIFTIVEVQDPKNESRTVKKMLGNTLNRTSDRQQTNFEVGWGTIESATQPVLKQEGSFFEYRGATLTAKAFDSIWSGFGFYVVPLCVWLFAISTIISWSYYGEQCTVFLFGAKYITMFRIVYCGMVLFATGPFISTETELDTLSSLGTGLMLFANVPIMLIFGRKTMKAYYAYLDRLKKGQIKRSS